MKGSFHHQLTNQIRRLEASPVSLSDAAHWRQVAHQQFEDGTFTGAILTNLPAIKTFSAAAASDIVNMLLWCPGRER